MTEKEALKVLHTYQKWRRGAKIPQPAPKEIGIAIDVAIRTMKKVIRKEKI